MRLGTGVQQLVLLPLSAKDPGLIPTFGENCLEFLPRPKEMQVVAKELKES